MITNERSTPGNRRNRPQQTSKWDTLHPGRRLAEGLPPNPLTAEQLVRMVADLFAGKAVNLIPPDQAVIEEDDEEN